MNGRSMMNVAGSIMLCPTVRLYAWTAYTALVVEYSYTWHHLSVTDIGACEIMYY